MNGFLIDTNVVSEFVRHRNPDPRVRNWLEAADTESLYASVLTMGEIRFGIELLSPGRRRRQLEQWLEQELREWFENRLLPVDGAIAERWGLMSAQALRKGRPLSIVDGLLAATALEHDLTLVTRNVGDFAGSGALILNPWT